MNEKKESKQPTSLDEAKRIVEREFLGTRGIHGVGKKASKNAVRVYASIESKALDTALSDIRSRCAPFDVDVVIEEKPIVALPAEETMAEQTDEPKPE